MAKIVFCEDELLIQKLVRIMLRSTKHDLYIASDGTEGLTLIERVRPNLIFTDISMPGMDGYQLADAIRANVELVHIPIVFISAFVQRAEIDEGYRHGAAAYLTKPFNAADLYEKIDLFATKTTPRAYNK